MKVVGSFIPVIVDGDVEKDACGKYGVQGYPTVKFLNAKGDELAGFLGAEPTGSVIGQAEKALKDNGPIKISKEYKKLLEARGKLEKALGAKKYTDALTQIEAIEKFDHKGLDFEFAQAHKAEIASIAEKRFAEAEEEAEKNKSKAKTSFERIQKEFKGLEIAEKAAARAKELAGA